MSLQGTVKLSLVVALLLAPVGCTDEPKPGGQPNAPADGGADLPGTGGAGTGGTGGAGAGGTGGAGTGGTGGVAQDAAVDQTPGDTAGDLGTDGAVRPDVGAETGPDVATTDAGSDARGDGGGADAALEAAPDGAHTDGAADAADAGSDVVPVAMCGRVLCDCTFKGKKLWGKVKFVTAGMLYDFRVQVVTTNFTDLYVKKVVAPGLANSCGEWLTDDFTPDFKVLIASDNYADFSIQYVDQLAGLPGMRR